MMRIWNLLLIISFGLALMCNYLAIETGKIVLQIGAILMLAISAFCARELNKCFDAHDKDIALLEKILKQPRIVEMTDKTIIWNEIPEFMKNHTLIPTSIIEEAKALSLVNVSNYDTDDFPDESPIFEQ